jgi:hypothetical protein
VEVFSSESQPLVQILVPRDLGDRCTDGLMQANRVGLAPPWRSPSKDVNASVSPFIFFAKT